MNAQLKPNQETTTTAHPVRVYRDWDKKLRAETCIMIDDTKELSISTSKSSSGMLVTGAHVMHIKDNSKSCVLFQDFSESRVLQSRLGRVTEKVILAQHGQVDIEALITKAKAFYHIKS